MMPGLALTIWTYRLLSAHRDGDGQGVLIGSAFLLTRAGVGFCSARTSTGDDSSKADKPVS